MPRKARAAVKPAMLSRASGSPSCWCGDDAAWLDPAFRDGLPRAVRQGCSLRLRLDPGGLRGEGARRFMD